ncbi:hypothetical protein ACFLRQ_03600 [Bacteroidota bacterium]
MIKTLQRKQIDNERWDKIIASSANETIYPYSWYLDACADNWLGIVMNDYEYIMPVAYRRKLGLKYTYQPIYCQQLGVYSKDEVEPEVTRIFLHALKKQFKVGDYSFNEGNLLGEEAGYEVSDNCNYIVSLNAETEVIQKNYTENCRRNIKRTVSSAVEFTEDISIDEIVNLKQMTESSQRNPGHYVYMKKLFTVLDKEGKIKTLGVRKGSHLIAAAIFAFSNTRAIFLLSASSESGKDQRSMFQVVNKFIQMHAGEDLKLDFEGCFNCTFFSRIRGETRNLSESSI